MMKTARARGHERPLPDAHMKTPERGIRSPEKHLHHSTETERASRNRPMYIWPTRESPFDNPEGSGRSGPIRRLVSPGSRSAFHGFQVPPTTGNLANPVTDNFQYMRFGYSMQTISHLFTCSSQSMTRPKKSPRHGGCTEGCCHNLPMNGDSEYTTGPADLPTKI